MEKYTELEQALQDPSLVIITDRITTQTDLNQIYVNYKTPPRKQKRFSNYYSNEFLGHSVPDMYLLMRDKLIADTNIFEWQMPSGKYTHTEPDLYYKEENFNSGDTNICFILGHSGSGKSMIYPLIF